MGVDDLPVTLHYVREGGRNTGPTLNAMQCMDATVSFTSNSFLLALLCCEGAPPGGVVPRSKQLNTEGDRRIKSGNESYAG